MRVTYARRLSKLGLQVGQGQQASQKTGVYSEDTVNEMQAVGMAMLNDV